MKKKIVFIFFLNFKTPDKPEMKLKPKISVKIKGRIRQIRQILIPRRIRIRNTDIRGINHLYLC